MKTTPVIVARFLYMGNSSLGASDKTYEVLLQATPRIGEAIALSNGLMLVRQVLYKLEAKSEFAAECDVDLPFARPTVIVGEPTTEEMSHLREILATE